MSEDDLVYDGELGIADLGKPENNLAFHVNGIPEPILELKENGDILVKGKLIENDIEVVDALREFLGYVKRDAFDMEDAE